MTYNKFYTKIIEDYILDSANDYKYKYHIVITFPNVANTDDYISSVYEYLNNTSFFLFAWHCNTITSPINNLNYNIIWDGKNRCKKIITKRVV